MRHDRRGLDWRQAAAHSNVTPKTVFICAGGIKSQPRQDGATLVLTLKLFEADA